MKRDKTKNVSYVNTNVDYNKLNPVFSFIYLDKKYSIDECTLEDKSKFFSKLVKLSQMTWQDIISTHRHGLGSETIKKDAIKCSINNVPEGCTFIALRFSEKKAMVGFRDKNIFHIVWFDRDFTLYNHGS